MSILVLIILLIAFGVVVYFVQRSQYIAQPFKWIIYGVIILVTVLILFQVFAPETASELRNTRVPTVD